MKPTEAIERLTIIAENLDLVKDITIKGPSLYTLQQHFTAKNPEIISGLAAECPACKNHTPLDTRFNYNYCPHCGQRWF